jgi:TRC40/GET3/ArsA family transport-energizing ATPase
MLLASEMKFLETPPRFLFFTGKGGVGKTSVACAAALHLAGRTTRVLLVSTDPASNVGQVLGITIGNTITPVDQVPGLSALEIDPGQAAEAYRERIIAPVRGLLPGKELAMITEQLSGSCTTEIASFNEFTALLAGESLTGRYDHVVFDTAPTGHTIRLLQLPGSWTGFLAAGKGDASCLGPLSGLEKQKAVYARAVGALKDPAQTRMVLVGRPQASALAEIERSSGELGQIGITGQYVVINAVLPQTAGEDDLTRAVRAREASALAAMPPAIAGLPRDMLSLKAANMIGVQTLSTLVALLAGGEMCVCDLAAVTGMSKSAASHAVRWLRVITGFERADAIASLIVVALILHAAWGLLRETGRILLEAAPEGYAPGEITTAITQQPAVASVHDVHAWLITSGFPALSALVLVRPPAGCHRVRRELEQLLCDRFALDHTTLQVDHAPDDLLTAGGGAR